MHTTKIKKIGRQLAWSAERRILEPEVRGSKAVLGSGSGVESHLTSPNRRVLRPRQPHYSQSAGPKFPWKDLISALRAW